MSADESDDAEPPPRFHLFDVVGIEIELMLCERDGLAVLPAADRLLSAAAVEFRAESAPTSNRNHDDTADADDVENEIELDGLAWSNELVLHVIEMKVEPPIPPAQLTTLAPRLTNHVQRANRLLAPLGGRLLPGGMHPFMDPDRDTRLWPHGYREVYATFDRIFGCRGHGWSNLQSLHINFPFFDDDEFGRLHAAVRLVLPILPALAASSPIFDGWVGACLDNRLEVYRTNSQRVPSVAGRVIPEPVFTEEAYRERIFAPMWNDIASLDPEGILRHEWLNARGAIARFERGSIELRVIDAQECPTMDIAIVDLVTRVVRAFCDEQFASTRSQQVFEIAPLESIFLACIRDGERATIDDASYLRALGIDATQATARHAWHHLTRAVYGVEPSDALAKAAQDLVAMGPLARRILHALGSPTAGDAVPCERLVRVYSGVASALQAGMPFGW